MRPMKMFRLTREQESALLALVGQLEGDDLEAFRVRMENAAFRLGDEFRIGKGGGYVDVTLCSEDCYKLAQFIEKAQAQNTIKARTKSKDVQADTVPAPPSELNSTEAIDALMQRVEESVER